jgi:hypothetical protein
MIDLDGSLRDTSPPVGSGNPTLDTQTLEIWPYYRYKTQRSSMGDRFAS